MDCLHLTGIRAYGYTGYFAEEQVLGQWFEVNLTLWVDLAIAGESDRLEDTLNYVKIIQGVQSLIETSKFGLIEKLASAIATQIFTVDFPIQKVKVHLTKLSPPIPNFSGQVAVEITRTNPQFPA